MDIEKGEHKHMMSRPIEVHIEGEGDVNVHALTLREPARCHMKKTSRLKQIVMGALHEASKLNKTDEANTVPEAKPVRVKTNEEVEADAKEIQELLEVALVLTPGDGLGEFVETFISMVTNVSKKPVILCDDRVPMKDIHFDQMSIEAIEKLAITYVSFFCMPSVMQSP